MTRNKFNQAKQQSGNPILGSAITNNLTTNKARQLFLEDSDNIDMKKIYRITNVRPFIDENDIVNKEYCDNNLLSSSNKIDILIINITEIRKGDFDKVTAKSFQLNKIQVNEKLINEFIKSANEVTNFVNFRNKVASDTNSNYNQLKQKFDNKKFDQNFTNIHLDDMFTTGLKEFREFNQKTNSAVQDALIKNKKTKVNI